jgi:hypothetical protein
MNVMCKGREKPVTVLMIKGCKGAGAIVEKNSRMAVSGQGIYLSVGCGRKHHTGPNHLRR